LAVKNILINEGEIMIRKLLFLAVLFLPVINCLAQLPPIFAETPREIIADKTIAEFPVNTFLENIAVNKKGDLFITSLEDGKIYRVSNAGAKSEFAKIDGKIAGLVFNKKENLIVSGWAGGTIPSVFIVSKQGKLESSTPVAGAIFLNGVTWLKGDKFLIADSYKGAIWEFDAKAKTSKVWLENEMFARSDEENAFPAVNGLKIFKNILYATNTERQQILRIPVLANGSAGKPEIWLKNINGDDFAFDGSGNLFLTTHVYNSVLKITPNGKTTVIAEDGNLIGDTSLVFGSGKNKNSIVVVTNGGISFPPKEGVQTAKVVKIEVGK
jgi:sugar lactone lactonase YvrE